LSRSRSASTTAGLNRNIAFLGFDIDKAAPRVLAAVMIYAAVSSLVAAASKPFWYDEMLTWILAQQPSVRAIWNALERAADSQGPAFYIIERAMSGTIPNQEIALRLPSIFGYCCITLCIFVFVRRRAGSVCALICAAVPLTTALFHVYAIEARAYSLFVACDAVALVCYQRASSWKWTLLMGFSLAFAQSLHYYAVFALVPFGLAEAARFLRRREFRIGVWLALVCGAVPLVVFWPLLWRLREVYGANHGPQMSFFSIAPIYGAYFEVTGRWGLAVIAVLALGVLSSGVLFATTTQTSPERESAFDEEVLTLALLGLPFAGYVATIIAHGELLPRYVLSTVLGVPLALGYIVARVGRRNTALIVVFLIFAIGIREGLFWSSTRARLAVDRSGVDSIEKIATAAGHPDLPVVISDGLQFLPLAHYAEPAWRERFACLVDPEKARQLIGRDGLDTELTIMRSLSPLHVYDFQTFAAEHPTFLLYSEFSTDDPFDWWPARFVQEGKTIQLVATERDCRVYIVNLNGKMD
jgi:4-amino-4-deoxy-L-arabinose transferase-like glycosyltransferase